MSNSQKQFILRIVRGSGKGQTFQLTGQETTIGTADRCDITQNGQYMSDVHAVIARRADGTWQLTNRSPNGTFVNRNRVDTQALNDGDYIQLGSETLIQFAVTEVAQKRSMFGSKGKPVADGAEEGGKSSIIKEKPGLVFGIGGYFLAIVALVVYFAVADFSETVPGLDQAEVQAAIEQTRSILQAQEDLPGRYEIDADSETTALFYSIIATARLRGNGAERSEKIERLTADLDRRFFVAWQLEKRSQLNLAAEEYEGIIDMAPDIRIPTTALASRRLAYIRGVMSGG